MLAVLDKSVAKSPQGLQNSNSEGVCALKDRKLARRFSSDHPNSIAINLGTSGSFSYSSDQQSPLLPRMIAGTDNIFCMFQGHIENIAPLKQQYGLGKSTNEVGIIIEAYRTLRDRGPYPVHQVVGDLKGKFSFILFDTSSKVAFVASDADGSVPFYWGNDSDGHLVMSEDLQTIKNGCGMSFAPFPKGCFYTSSGGLRSFEYPHNELKPVPWKDSSGQVFGSSFKIDTDSPHKKPGMPRVGSESNWSSHI